ncbi:MAG: M20/M25/M40 family metallo-hydrolase [Deltaproteobacteria bacterium]
MSRPRPAHTRPLLELADATRAVVHGCAATGGLRRWGLLACRGLACGGLACGGATNAPPPARPATERRVQDPAWMEAAAGLLARAERGAQTYDLVAGLTDAAGPRLAGSAGDPLAVAWGLGTMQALGLTSVRAEPVTVRVWVRGEERVEVLSPVPHRLAAAALGGSVGTPPGGLEGELVRVASLEELRALAPERARGRIVFVDQRMARAQDGHGYGETVPIRGQSASVAAGLGAIAVLIRSVGTDQTRFPHTGAMRYVEGVPQIPAAAVSNPDADVLARWIEAGQAVRVRLELGAHDGGQAQSANVIGEVSGTDRADEIVLLGAHLDSWALGRGAVDDGAGCAIVLEVARWLAQAEPPPRRTVRVVLFANEENGLAGARAYAAAHREERHVLGLEADFGDGRAWALRTPDLTERAEPSSISSRWDPIARLLAPMGVVWQPEEPHGGADLGPMHDALPDGAGMPVVDVMQDGTRYFDLHHTANDILTQIDGESLDHAMRAVLAVAYAASLE